MREHMKRTRLQVETSSFRGGQMALGPGTLVLAAAFLGALLLWPSSVTAHSWYPAECCSQRDCMPADSMSMDARGDLLVIVGTQKIWVPRGFDVRPSQDNRIHICFHLDDHKFLMPLCLFIPAQS